MKSIKSQINLRIVNNTALPQPVSILGIVPNSNTANNNNFLYVDLIKFHMDNNIEHHIHIDRIFYYMNIYIHMFDLI